jgi:hypothetical protein
LALAVPLSRFTSQVGGGSAFFVRPLTLYPNMIAWMLIRHDSWYGWMFLGLAFVVIFPDEFLENIRLPLTWRYLIWLEAILISIVVGAVIVLKHYYTDLRWFFPLIPFGVVAVFRVILWRLTRSDGD